MNQDYGAAAIWITKAAKGGYAPAQYYLGLMYANGKGVPRDYPRAYAWVSVAAESELPQAGRLLKKIGKKLNPAELGRALELAMSLSLDYGD